MVRSGTARREFGQFRELREVNDVFVDQAPVGENPGAGAQLRVRQLVLDGAAVQLRIGVPTRVVPDTAESVGAGRLERVEDAGHIVAEGEVGVADDRGGGPGWPIQAGGAGGGDALDELDLAYRPQLFRSVGPVHGSGFQEHRGAHVMSAVHIRGQFIQ